MIDREIPILCYVTDRRSLSAAAGAAESAVVEKIATIAAAGVDWVQIREKDLAAQELTTLTRAAVARTRGLRSDHPTRLIVNSSLEVAIAEGAGGVHLGESSLSVSEIARRLKRSESDAGVSDHGVASGIPVALREDFVIGASCHSLEQAKAAARDGADYIFFGPVFATPSKAKLGAPQGVKELMAVCSAVPLPVLAIGGITLESAAECIGAGAAGIAAIRLFQDADDPAKVVSALTNLRR